MAVRNPSLAAQNMPPEFRFKPTKIYYDKPPRNTVYEDALGSGGKAPIDPRLQRLLDPITWKSDRSPVANMQQSAHGVISKLIHEHKHSQTPRTIIRKNVPKITINTRHEEQPGARQPLMRGNRTPQQVARGVKTTHRPVRPGPDINKINAILDPRRGFKPGSAEAYRNLLMQATPESVEQIAAKAERAAEKREEPTTSIGSHQFTDAELQAAPPGLIKVMVDRELQRRTKKNKPRVMFDPRESRGLSTHGQYTTIPRPGLVEFEPGKFMRPEQLGMTANEAVVAMDSNGQPKPKVGGGSILLGLGAAALAILGLSMVVGGR